MWPVGSNSLRDLRRKKKKKRFEGGTRIWTGDLSICSRMLYHWAIPPLYSLYVHVHSSKASRVCEEVFRKYPKFTKMSHKASFMTLSSTEYCGKMQILEKLLETFHKDNDKVIIFSMSVKVSYFTCTCRFIYSPIYEYIAFLYLFHTSMYKNSRILL